MHTEENGAVKNSEDRWRLWTAKKDAAVADRFAKQSSEYGAFALATFVYESHDQRLPPSRSLFSGHA